MPQIASADTRRANSSHKAAAGNSRTAVQASLLPIHDAHQLGNQAMLRLQRKCDCGGGPDCDCDSKEKKQHKGGLRRAPAGSGTTPQTAPPIVHETLQSPGEMLDRDTRAFFESRFGQDFSGVRIHTDSRAAESARAVNALAYTVGRDIAFASGRFAPATTEGRRLLAHELTHTVQQRGSAIRGISRQAGNEQSQNVSPVEQQANQSEKAVSSDVAPGDTGEPQPVDPGETPGEPTTAGAACPVSAFLSSFAVGLGEGKGCKVNCRPATGNSGTGRLAHFRLSGLPSTATNVTIDEQFTPLDENPPGIGASLQQGSNTAVNGFFDDCYCIETPNQLPPDFRLRAQQNHLLNGVTLDKNEITFTAAGIRFCHFDRKQGGCDFGGRCKL